MVKHVDQHVIADEQRVLLRPVAVERQEFQDGGRTLLDGQALELHFRRQLRQRCLHPVVDVDHVDVGIGAEVEADGQRVAAVIAADRLHVDHLVDADDLRLDRLGDGAFHHRGGGAGIGGADRDLRRHDVGQLSDRNSCHRQRAGEGDHNGDDDRQPRAVDEDGRNHRPAPPCSEAGLADTGGLAGPGETTCPGCTRCTPSTTTRSPGFRPLSTPASVGGAWPSCTRRLLHFVLRIDGIDVVAALVGQHRGARHGQQLHRFHALYQDGDEFAVYQLARRRVADLAVVERRIGNGATQHDCIGAGGHCVVDEIQLAGLAVEAAVRQADLYLLGVESTLVGIVLAQLQRGAQRHREHDIHRVLADDRRQHAGAGGNHVAGGDRGTADLAADRRADFRIAKVDLRGPHLRFRVLHQRGVGQHGGAGIIHGGLLAGRGAQQRHGAVIGDRRVHQVGLQLLHRGLLGGEVRLEGRLFQDIEQVALLHLGAFGEQALLQEGGDPGDQGDAVHRLDATDEFGSFRDRPHFRPHNADGRRPAVGLRPGLVEAEPDKGSEQAGRQAQAHP